MRSERGFVLLQVMLVFSLLVIVAAGIQYDQRLHIERTRQALLQSQAQVYMDSGEAIAELGLVLDSNENQKDHLFELWNTQEFAFPLEGGGFINMDLNDLQGRFNLNWLAVNEPDGPRQAFERLLSLLTLETSIATELVEWFKARSLSNVSYADQTIPYANAAMPMADVSELMLLKTIDDEVFDVIRPYVNALPVNEPLNINTAPAYVLQSVASFIDDSAVQTFLQAREETGFDSVNDWQVMPIFEENADKTLFLNSFDIASSWFELYTQVILDDGVFHQTTQFYRTLNEAVPVMRNRSLNEANPMPDDPLKWFDE